MIAFQISDMTTERCAGAVSEPATRRWRHDDLCGFQSGAGRGRAHHDGGRKTIVLDGPTAFEREVHDMDRID